MLDLTKSNSSLYCVFLGSNMNLECHIQLINLSFKCLCVLLVYHCKLTDSSGYWQLLHALHAPKSLNMYFLHRLLALLTCAWYAAVSYLSYTTSLILQAHARPHYTSCQSSVLLFPGSHSAFCQWQKESYHSSFTRKATVQTQVISGATIWSGQQIDYTQAYPNCGDGGGVWYHSQNSRGQAAHIKPSLIPPLFPCIILIANRRTKTWKPGNEATTNLPLTTFLATLYKYKQAPFTAYVHTSTFSVFCVHDSSITLWSVLF